MRMAPSLLIFSLATCFSCQVAAASSTTVTITAGSGSVSIWRRSDCASGPLFRGSAIDFFRIGFIDNGGISNDFCHRGVFRFDTGSIPDTATILKVELDANVSNDAGVGDVDFSALAADPETQTDLDLWTALAPSGNDYVANIVPPSSGWFEDPNVPIGVDLGTNAVADLQASLSADFFAVGVHRGDHVQEFGGSGTGHHYLTLEMGQDVAVEAQLYVTFTAAPPPVPALPLLAIVSLGTLVGVTGILRLRV